MAYNECKQLLIFNFKEDFIQDTKISRVLNIKRTSLTLNHQDFFEKQRQEKQKYFFFAVKICVVLHEETNFFPFLKVIFEVFKHTRQ